MTCLVQAEPGWAWGLERNRHEAIGKHSMSPAPTPTLPIILFSVFAGVGSGVLAFFLCFETLGLGAAWSSGLTSLVLMAVVSGSAALLSRLYDERTVGINVGFGCGLTLLVALFAGFCLLIGLFAGTLALTFG
ncbi:MAG: hypothetical protein WAU10_24250 [Caldilineaceae bacterium]